MPRQDKTHDTPEQVEESWAERLDDFQATSDSKFGDINATLRRLDDPMLTNENHLLTTNEHLQASDKRNVANKIAIDKRFGDITVMLGQLLQHQRHRLRSRSSRSSSSRSTHVDDHAHPNNLGLNLTSMVLMVHNATTATNKAIMNIFIKLHNMMHHVW
jgi:hypothetical protein